MVTTFGLILSHQRDESPYDKLEMESVNVVV